MTAEPVGGGGDDRRRSTKRSVADEVLDELVPDQLDWRDLVVRYPIPALLIATLGGYWLGSRRGRDLASAAAVFADQRVDEQVARFLSLRSD